MDRQERFMKMYPNIPLGARNEIVAVVDKVDLTYKDIYMMIIDKKGQLKIRLTKALELMDLLHLIPFN